MRILTLALLVASAAFGADDLPIIGLAHVGFRTSDLEKARAFYSGVLGYDEAFALKNDTGDVSLAYFKINDDQYIEIFPGLPPEEDVRLTHVAFQTSDIDKLRRMLSDRGIDAPKPQRGRDGNLNLTIKDPESNRLEFVEYRPGSLHSNGKGKHLGPRRISTHLLHAGITIANLEAAMAFYAGKLGFREIWRGGPTDDETRWINMRTPGERGDYVEFMLYSKPPTRAQLGSMHHICLEVSDIQDSWKQLQQRNVPNEQRHRPRVGRNKRWQLNLFDPDGSRAELMH